MTNSYRVYGVFDKVAGIFGMFFHSKTDGLAARTALSTLRFPLRDADLYQLGSYEVLVEPDKALVDDFESSVRFSWLEAPRLVPWDSYKFPEDISEALAPLNLSQSEIAEIARNKIKAVSEGKGISSAPEVK